MYRVKHINNIIHLFMYTCIHIENFHISNKKKPLLKNFHLFIIISRKVKIIILRYFLVSNTQKRE